MDRPLAEAILGQKNVSEAEMTESCETCRFWDNWSGEGNGWCRRNAPHAARYHEVVTFEDDGAGVDPSTTSWPDTQSDDWCGEYQPAKPDVVWIGKPAEQPPSRMDTEQDDGTMPPDSQTR